MTTPIFEHQQEMTKILTLETINQNILKTKYAVRGELAIRADRINRELDEGIEYPFKKVTYCNIGNPQQLNQKPITFFRQVMALLEMKEWLNDEDKLIYLKRLYPTDAIERALKICSFCPSIGAYSSSNGLLAVRKSVAEFITKRDGGFSADPDKIYLTNGASEGIARIMNAIVAHDRIGVMIPVPQYPLYTATLAMLNGRAVEYYLDEFGSEGWRLDLAELKRSLKAARDEGIQVRALVLINPGNPTGSILSRQNIEELIKFCCEERLIILADEVYQENVYEPERRPFISVRRVLMEMGEEFSRGQVELVSFHSTSKGLLGECGRRGGYFECHGFDAEVEAQLFKVASVSLCSNLMGQLMVHLMVDPPKEGDPSFELYRQEKQAIWESLKRRSKKLCDTFNGLKGVSCVAATGAMYLFPKFEFPPKMIEAARRKSMDPDTFYALALLNSTGVCMVPGSGFRQASGTWHLRTSFLPPEEEFEEFCGHIARFHESFYQEYQ